MVSVIHPKQVEIFLPISYSQNLNLNTLAFQFDLEHFYVRRIKPENGLFGNV